MKIPPTRNHRQLAKWINENKLVYSLERKRVRATVMSYRNSTDTKIAGTRFRRQGKGRQGLLLEILVDEGDPIGHPACIYRHESGETYRRHSEAREWVEKYLRKAGNNA
jgi:hypothetical protein